MRLEQDPEARVRRSHQLQGHDPVDFPFYGLDPAWDGMRYVQDLEVEDGRPLRALGLGHHTRDHCCWVLVSSMPRSARDQWFRRDDDAAEAGAMVALDLLELQRPPEATRLDEVRSGPYNRVVVERMYELAAAASAGQWPRTSIQVEGQAHEAHWWRHAQGWGAFLLGLPDVVVRVVAVGVEPDEIALTRVDAAPYHFSISERLSIETLTQDRHEHSDHRLPLEHTKKLHPDHHQLAARAGITLNPPR